MPAISDLKQQFWKADVESFERWKRIRAIAVAANMQKSVDFANSQLFKLQERWPNHKLGDM